MKNSSFSHEHVKILGVRIDSTSKKELLSQIQVELGGKRQFYIVTPNPEIILEAGKNTKLKEILNKADFSVADGVGLKIADKSLEVIKGRELMMDLLWMANEKKLKVYLLGGRTAVNRKSVQKIKDRYPGIKVRGNGEIRIDQNGYPEGVVDTSIQMSVIKEINAFKPDICFVAFGAPKQELWIHHFKDEVKAGCIMAVGGSLDYFAGAVKPVPDILEKMGLEWLWRLIQEPGRWRRIFNALVVFPLAVMKERNSNHG